VTLPRSFGNLSNLKHLTLVCEKLESLPETIGNLSDLMKLDFSRCPSIQILPNSIQNLSNLKVLALGISVESLPEWIGNLSNLENIDLSECEKIKTLPESFFKLRSLRCFRFWGSGITARPFDKKSYILTLTQRFPSLVYIDHMFDPDEECRIALLRNAFRQKNPFITKGKKSSEAASKLWPRALSLANYGLVDDDNMLYPMEYEDAMYWLLNDSMSSFLDVLLNRKL